MTKQKTSPTQLETFKLCARKWWLIYVRKIRVPRGKQFVFGSVLHAACERFLLDQPLWPDDWEKDPDSKDRVNPAEAALIQVLVKAGIEAGILEKRPGGEVEKWMYIDWEEYVVQGLQDYRTEDRVEDHKTSKSERYMKSSAALKKSIQMMLYAKERVNQFRKKGKMPPKVITIAHNQYKKDFDDPMVRRREAEVSPAEIDKFWEEEVVPLLESMREVRKVENPFDIDDPEAKACRAFGGCEFVSVCGGAEELLTFERRMSNLKTSTQKRQPMSTKSPNSFLASRRKGKTPPAGKPTVNPPKPEAKAPEPETEPMTSSDFVAPPWASDKCPLCSKSEYPGFNIKTGKPCRICPTKSGTTADGYEWEVTDGVPVWFKEGEEPTNGPTPSEVKDKGTKTDHLQPAVLLPRMRNAETQEELDEILMESEQADLSEDDADALAKIYGERGKELAKKAKEPKEEPKKEEEAPKTKARARKKRSKKAEEREPEPKPEVEPEIQSSGLTLLIGCGYMKGAVDAVFAEDILAKLDGYWQNDAVFDRRGELRKAVESQGDFLAGLAGMTIVQQGRDPDVDNLMSALIPHADVVIRGTIQ